MRRVSGAVLAAALSLSSAAAQPPSSAATSRALAQTSAPPAGSSATGPEVAALSSAAASGDTGALRSLRQIREVDGRQADLAAALGGAPEEAATRLRALAGLSSSLSPRTDPRQAAAVAAEIVSERRFRPLEAPKPFLGLLDLIARLLLPLGEVYSAARDFVAENVPPWAGLPVLAAAAAWTAWLVARSRLRGQDAARPSRVRPADDARRLEREADVAEADGRGGQAVRLRFRAGLIRLGERGAIAYRPSLTTGEVRRDLQSRDFEPLAQSHDEIVYGGRAAGDDDVASSREGWPKVLRESAG